MKNQRIAAVIPTFNKRRLLLECLNALRNQTIPLDGIFIIDNSSLDDPMKALYKHNYIKEPAPKFSDNTWETVNVVYSSKNKKPLKIYYARFYTNSGATGGFHEGIKRAYRRGYNWIWLMDDDSEPKLDALEKLLKYSILPNVLALTCKKIDDDKISYIDRGFFNFKDVLHHFITPVNDSEYNNNEYLEIEHSSWTGLLINRNIISKIGLPDKRFFIYFGDVEYCIRLRKHGKIILVMDSIIHHKEQKNKNIRIKKRFLGRIYYRKPYDKHFLYLHYYSTRNLIYLGRKNSKSKLKFLKRLIADFIIEIKNIICVDDFKLKRIILLTFTHLEGLLGKFNNRKPREILFNKRYF